jgi:hypothetical protein
MLLRFEKLIIAMMLCCGCLYAIPGGYSNISITDPQVQNAANFATSEINSGSLSRIVTAESQVVAGINYKLTLEISDKNGIVRNYKVVVFVPLPSSGQPMQLTNVAEILSD